jgi:hypothetical protein
MVCLGQRQAVRLEQSQCEEEEITPERFLNLFMKMNFAPFKKLLALTVAGLALNSSVMAAPPSPAGTTGEFTWDCLSSGGGQPGIAYFTFFDNNTFVADLLPAGTTPPPPVNPRGGSGSTGRGGSGTSTNSVSKTNVFGYSREVGPWGFDLKGRVVGSFIQVIATDPHPKINWNTIEVNTGPIPYTIFDYQTGLVTVTTNISFFVDSEDGSQGYLDTISFSRTFVGPSSTRTYEWSATNVNDGFVNDYTTNLTFFNLTTSSGATTNFSYTFAAATLETNAAWTIISPNGFVNNYSVPFEFENTLGFGMTGVYTNRVSFTGTVSPGKRLTLLASSIHGKITYTGVPLSASLPDISGNWYGVKQAGTHKSGEFFAIGASGDPYLFYVDTGAGPGYDLTGIVMISSKKKIAFDFTELAWGATNSHSRATWGSLSVSTKATRAITTGTSVREGNIKFDALKQQ